MVQRDATGIFLRIPKSSAHCKSAKILATCGSSRSRSCSNGASILVLTAVLKPPKSTAFEHSTMLGMEARRMLSGLGLDPIQSSHSSVRTKVMRREFVLDDKTLQRLIMALMWPCNGKGTATTWKTAIGSMPAGSM